LLTTGGPRLLKQELKDMERAYRIEIFVDGFIVSEVVNAKNLENAIEKAKGIVDALNQHYHCDLSRLDEVIPQ
jgi:hypothetical protein